MLALILPYLWTIIGYFVVEKADVRTFFALIMLYVLIPAGTFYAFSYYQGNLYAVMLTVALIKAVMYFIGLKFYRSRQFSRPVTACIFGYFNLGWLGIPVASVIFGESGALIMTAAYMVGQFYGNTLAVAAFESVSGKTATDSKQSQLPENIADDANDMPDVNSSVYPETAKSAKIVRGFRKILLLPATYAMLLGIINRQWPFIEQAFFGDAFTYIKIGMTVVGMSLIGMSLKKSGVGKSEYKKALRFSVYRVLSAVIATSLVLTGISFLHILSVQELLVLTMVACLPVGANVVVLEHALLKSGKTAAIVAVTTLVSAGVLLVYANLIKMFI